jgi:hypothetical protein
MRQENRNHNKSHNGPPHAGLLGFTFLAMAVGIVLNGASEDAHAARQAEQTVEQLQEADSTTSVIAEQQAEAQQHYAAERWDLEVELPGLLALEGLGVCAIAGAAALKRKNEQE